ncbi:MAG TPA: hypothetical protein VN726_06595 [Hanamia sp.]|nr:hypothetical protein [Hanamia sp.]
MKKFIISSDVLKKVLSKLNNAVAKNTVLPVLSNLLCKVTDRSVEFISTDLEVTIQYRCECETSGDGFEFLLPFQLIHKIVGFSKNVPLTFSQEKVGIKITGDNDVYEIKTPQKVEDFPKLQELPKDNPMPLNEDVLKLLVDALGTVGKNDKYPQVMKVLLEIKNGTTTVASTDGSFMVFSYSLPNEDILEEDLLISEKVIKAMEGLEEVNLTWNGKNMVFDTKEVTVIVTRPDMKFVNFRAIFPADYPSNLTVNRSELISALDRCNINSDPFKQTSIELKSKKGKIVFSAKDSNYNINIEVEVEGNYTGPTEQIKLSSEKMLKLINQVDFENIELAIHEPNKAILFRSPDHEGYVSLLMPIFSNQ